MKLRVLLVEDSALFRKALASLLSPKRTFYLEACTSRSVLKRWAQMTYDVLVIDAVTWSAGSESLIQTIRQASTSAPAILLGRDDLVGSDLQALRAGAVGFVKQTAPPGVLFDTIRAVLRKRICIDSTSFKKAMAILPEGQTIVLNPREKQIVNLVANGKTNKEIGTCLGLTERMIKAYVANLCRRIGVPNRSALASYAIVHSLVPFTPAN